jgi:hypothetical protein
VVRKWRHARSGWRTFSRTSASVGSLIWSSRGSKIHTGEIPALRLSEYGPLRIDRRELEAWLYGPGGASLLSARPYPAERGDLSKGVDSPQPAGREEEPC